MSEPRFTPPAEDFEPPPELEPLPEPAEGTPQPPDRDLPEEWPHDAGTTGPPQPAG
ncbi:hypothetical protein ACFQZ4_42295 [Catellatospora coxensis]|uniref:Uncharacterized protein n=1 Tax=Catellatospora coxensis TaxID=310354 RepID=A0A8J3PDI0_9ACTN|nr:hypothetical protein [Catellatospora coxensis]GIG11081.1 hypothetical protein Cco03nite_77810 [Catellatospora coxensis]